MQHSRVKEKNASCLETVDYPFFVHKAYNLFIFSNSNLSSPWYSWTIPHLVLTITIIGQLSCENVIFFQKTWHILHILILSTYISFDTFICRSITPQFSWNITKVGAKHQSINQSIRSINCCVTLLLRLIRSTGWRMCKISKVTKGTNSQHFEFSF